MKGRCKPAARFTGLLILQTPPEGAFLPLALDSFAIAVSLLAVLAVRTLTRNYGRRLSVEGVRGGNLERRAAVEKQCAPRMENPSIVQKGRLETVAPTPPKEARRNSMYFSGARSVAASSDLQ